MTVLKVCRNAAVAAGVGTSDSRRQVSRGVELGLPLVPQREDLVDVGSHQVLGDLKGVLQSRCREDGSLLVGDAHQGLAEGGGRGADLLFQGVRQLQAAGFPSLQPGRATD